MKRNALPRTPGDSKSGSPGGAFKTLTPELKTELSRHKTPRGVFLTEANVKATESEADRHFKTDHLHADLRGRSIRGGVVTLGAQAIKFIVQLGSTAILARLLTPADFGLVAMVGALIGVMFLFSDLGLSMATVQQAEITHQQASTLFWINVAFSVVLTVIGFLLAPLVAWFYAEPRLTWVMFVLSTTFVLGGLTAQHYALLVRRMRFGAAAFVLAASSGAGAVVGIALASVGCGYWSLVAMALAGSISAGLMSWMLSGWLPSFPARSANLRAMLGFGGALTGSNILTYAIRNLDNVIVGRFNGPEALGLYSKAYGIVLLPVQQISNPLKGVLVPVLSRLQEDPARFRRYYIGALGLLALGSMPLVAFAFADARHLVSCLLGNGWMAAVPLFQFLAAGAFIGIVTGTADWVLISLGRANRLLKWYAVSGPLTVISFFVGVYWGTAGVAIAFSASSCVLAMPNLWWALSRSPIRFLDIALAVWRPMFASVLSAILLMTLVSNRLTMLPPLALAIDGLVYLCLYASALLVIPGGGTFLMNAAAMVRQR